MYLVNMPPCIATTYSLISMDDKGAAAIINGTRALTAEDVVSFTLLPCSPNNSICVMSWLRGSQRAYEFLELYKINELAEREQQELFLSIAFASPIIFISSKWWRSLSEEKKEEYTRLHLSAGREHAELV